MFRETNMPNLKEKIGLYDKTTDTPTNKGYVLAIIAFVIGSLLISLFFFETWIVPDDKKTFFSMMPMWIVIPAIVCLLLLGIWVFFPSRDFRRYVSGRQTEKERRLEEKQSQDTSRRRRLLVHPIMRQFSRVFSSPYLEDYKHGSKEFVAWCFETLSFGYSEIDADKFSDIISAFVEEPDYEGDSKTAYDRCCKEAKALVDIWTSRYAFGGFSLVVGSSWDTAAQSLESVGRALGIEEMVKAYYNDVPIEHVLA